MSPLLAPLDPAAWSERHARHLLNRAGFGVPFSRIGELVQLGLEKAVDALVDYERFADNATEPEGLPTLEEMRREQEEIDALDPEERRARAQMMQRRDRQAVDGLKVWWLTLMRETSRPLQEKMALFWHGHFATSAQKVNSPRFNYHLNDAFRKNATGNFKALTMEVGRSPAMLRYLDNGQNRKGKPNENWARELMELFTLGIGHYTEDDIKEAARAFSGYSLDRKTGTFVLNRQQHDYGEKTFMGRRGKFDGADIMDIIFEQPAAAEFVPRKLWEFFAYEAPSDAVAKELAAVFRTANFELKPLLKAIFKSAEFYAPKAFRNQVKSPAQYLVMLQEHLDFKPRRGGLANIAMRALGQELFYPPNVKGWAGNRAWINTTTLLARYNIPHYVLTGDRPELVGRQRLTDAEVAAMAGMNGMDDEDDDGPPPKNDRERKRRLERAKQRLRRQALSPVALKELFRPFDGRDAAGVVDGLADRFFGAPLDAGQRETLAAAFDPKGKGKSPFKAAQLDEDRAVGLLHLMLSMAEYQLC